MSFYLIILSLVILLIASIPMSLKKDTKDTARFASYLDIHIEIDNES